jgi:ApbE superfamily uncharacterized protein (UPF0280 family)
VASGPVAALTLSGLKLHLQHGPIDLIITADGPADARRRAFRAAAVALEPVLEDLVTELDALKMLASSRPVVVGPVARRMVQATSYYGDRFITPMAAVAGAVADHIVEMAMDDDLDRFTVNNGGDIAFALHGGASTTVGLVVSPLETRLAGTISINALEPVRGLATSGWRGRSFSLGIADAVTVLAADAATADAAATAIASAVDIPGHSAIERIPANQLDDRTDLGTRLVTVGVGQLSDHDRRCALEPGTELASELLERRVISAAFLVVGGEWVSIHAEALDPFAAAVFVKVVEAKGSYAAG